MILPSPIHLHAGHFSRQLAATPPVAVISSAFEKRNRVRTVFNNCNFSLILSGRGSYLYRGRELPVEAPCVITQWPGEPMDYGALTSWNEIYFIYPPETEEGFRRAGLLSMERPIWPIRNPENVSRDLAELSKLVEKTPDGAWGDRIDLLCYSIVLETLIGRPRSGEMPEMERRIRSLAAELAANPEREVDWEEIAEREKISFSTLRRAWLRYIKIPPGLYLAERKIALACRLLTETELPIGEIAARLHFRDPLYFSRFFRQRTGFTAGEYRRTRRMG